MPAYARKIRGKWRVVHGVPSRLVLNRARTPVDGGGFPSRAKAEAQARAIIAREGGYPRRPAQKRKRIRRNPAQGVAVLVWIYPDGSVLELPRDRTHFTAVPRVVAQGRHVRGGRLQRGVLSELNREGYFRGAVLNDRLYVLLNSSHPLSSSQRKALRIYAARNRLSRGIVYERRRA